MKNEKCQKREETSRKKPDRGEQNFCDFCFRWACCRVSLNSTSQRRLDCYYAEKEKHKSLEEKKRKKSEKVVGGST